MQETDQEGNKPGTRGGVNISGDANVSVGRDLIGGDKIVQGDEYDVEGDINTVTIGAGAQVGQVAAGRNINQSSVASNDAKELAQKLLELQQALQAQRAQLDETKAEFAEYQLRDIQEELTKTGTPPNAARLTKAADGLLKNVPALGGPLGAVFKTAAAQNLVARAGAADWSKQRFG